MDCRHEPKTSWQTAKKFSVDFSDMRHALTLFLAFAWWLLVSRCHAVRLLSNDGVIFEVDDATAQQKSGLLRDLMAGLGPAMEGRGRAGENVVPFTNDVIPLPRVESPVLDKVLGFMRHHGDDGEPEDRADASVPPEYRTEWDRAFLAVNETELFDIAMAANYMDVRSLFNAVVSRIASLTGNRSIEEIREIFHL